MRKNELGDLYDMHHLPREHKKSKKHQRGFREDVEEGRQRRVGFKNYLRDIKENESSLTPMHDLDHAAKQEILNDFKEWSGGFNPDECSEHELSTYVSMTMPAKYDEEAALEFLGAFTSEKWEAGEL